MKLTRRTLTFALIFASAMSISCSEQSGLKVLSYNVWYGFTRKPDRKTTYLKWVKQQAPDIVALQELNKYTADKLAADAKSWGHEHSVLLKEKGFPTGISSRYPIEDVRRVIKGMHHGLIVCRIRDIWIYVIHFHPSNWEFREKEVRLVLDDIKKLPGDNPDVMLIGDFNGLSPQDKTYYAKTRELVDFFAPRDKKMREKNLKEGKLHFDALGPLLDSGLVDVVCKHRKAGELPFGTFPTKLRAGEDHGAERRLDYILCTPDLAKKCVSASNIVDDTTSMLSDHYPVIAEFRSIPPK